MPRPSILVTYKLPSAATAPLEAVGDVEVYRGGVLTHVMTHGMHHRAQCLNMFRQLGVKGPPSAVVEWMLMVDNPQ